MQAAVHRIISHLGHGAKKTDAGRQSRRFQKMKRRSQGVGPSAEVASATRVSGCRSLTWAQANLQSLPSLLCGNSSVGRARPCQGRGREFESRFPLQCSIREALEAAIDRRARAFWYPDLTHRGWVAEWSCSGLQSRVRRFDSDPSLHFLWPDCPGGGIGRRYGLKIRWPQGRARSTRARGTTSRIHGNILI